MVKLSLCLAMHHAMKTYWGLELERHAFFDLGPRRSRVVSFTRHEERAPVSIG